MFGIGTQELVIICVVALLVFGPKRLPELARMLGKGMTEFRRASNDLRSSLELDHPATPRPTPAPPRIVPRPVSQPPTDPREQREPDGLPAQSIAPEPPPAAGAAPPASPASPAAGSTEPAPDVRRDAGSE
jgi:TatA/E family protein of Tat protein translocase